MAHRYFEDERRDQSAATKKGEVTWGYLEHNGRLVPDFKVARTATIEQVFGWLGIVENMHRVNGANGAELRGWCPWGDHHGKQGSFSINVESGKGMCHACKRACSHVIKFMTLYIDTHEGSPLFSHLKFKGDQAAATWLIEHLQDDVAAVEVPSVEVVEEFANEVFAPIRSKLGEQDTQLDNSIIHDTDAIAYALDVLGQALRDKNKLREIVEILARPSNA